MPGTRKKPAAISKARPARRQQFRAKLFRNGGSQAVRLPKECRLPGDEVAVTLDGDRIVLEPIDERGFTRDFVELFLSGKSSDPGFPDREQPPNQERDLDF
ncbi:MAG: AbrB/MazE/SpoVT family DNA-binding domain-containing protein [Myxococcota bacterium]|nr:AbrB/MazE/SpoVT family DNA-binding domain-containing protein [Myxococcota bacterium]